MPVVPRTGPSPVSDGVSGSRNDHLIKSCSSPGATASSRRLSGRCVRQSRPTSRYFPRLLQPSSTPGSKDVKNECAGELRPTPTTTAINSTGVAIRNNSGAAMLHCRRHVRAPKGPGARDLTVVRRLLRRSAVTHPVHPESRCRPRGRRPDGSMRECRFVDLDVHMAPRPNAFWLLLVGVDARTERVGVGVEHHVEDVLP